MANELYYEEYRTVSLVTRVLASVARTKIKGGVDQIKRSHIVGWAVALDSHEPAKVELCVDGHTISATYATQKRNHEPEANGDNVGFRFGIRKIWKYLRKGHEITVHANGVLLEFSTGKNCLVVKSDGSKCENGDILTLIRAGCVINKNGRIQKDRGKNSEWAQRVFPAFTNIQRQLEREFGKIPFAFYGTLLGYAREGGIMAHDNDLDIAYFTSEQDPLKVREEFYTVSKYFVENDTQAIPFHNRIKFKDLTGSMAPCWFTDGTFYSTIAFVGDGFQVEEKDIFPLKTAEHAGFNLFLPNNEVHIARYLYGRGWKYPDPGWRWREEYRSWPICQAARLTDDQVENLLVLKRATSLSD